MSALASYRGSLRVAADGPEHPRIAEAAAEHIRERLLNLLVGGARVLVEEGFGGEHHAAQAKAALRGLLVDEGLLDRMWLLSCAESFERRDLGFRHGAHRRNAGSDRLAVGDDRARSTLAEATAEFGTAQFEVVAQNEQQRRGRIDVDIPSPPIHPQGKGSHGQEDTPVSGRWGLWALGSRLLALGSGLGLGPLYFEAARRFSMSGSAASTTSPTICRLRAVTYSIVS